MRGNCKRLVHIVNDMLALARADTGEQPLHLEELYLNDLVEGCAGVHSPCQRARSELQGVNLNYDTTSDIIIRSWAMRSF